MKRLTLFKNAFDFAFSNIGTTDQVQLDIDAANAFKAAGFDAADYNYWKQCAQQARSQFLALNQQPSPSAQATAVSAARGPQAAQPAVAETPAE